MYFETIKCFDEEIFNLDWHQKRIARTIGLNINLQEYIYPPSEKLLKCKLIYDDTGILDITFVEYKQRDINSFKIIVDNEIEYKNKSINRDELDILFNLKEQADEIIIVKNGFVTDISIANIAILVNDTWITPKLPLLKGTCRDRLIDENFLIEKDITIDELINSQKIALMNAMIDFKIIENSDIINKDEVLKGWK